MSRTAAAVCWAALLALSSGSCADEESSAACPGLDDDDCNIGEASCQQQIFAATACLRGQPDAQLPPIRTITREEYADELRGQSAPEEDFGVRVWGSALGLFGLGVPLPAVAGVVLALIGLLALSTLPVDAQEPVTSGAR